MGTESTATSQHIAQVRASITITLYGLAKVRKQLYQKTGILDLDAYKNFVAVHPPSLTMPKLDTDSGFQWSDLDPTKHFNQLKAFAQNLVAFGNAIINYVNAVFNFLATIATLSTVRDELKRAEGTLLARLGEYEKQLAALIQDEERALQARREQYNRDLTVGEVALYTGINYGGGVAGAAADINAVELDANSLRLGVDTGVTLYSSACFEGVAQDIPVSVPTLAGSKLQGAAPRSVKVWHTADKAYTGRWAIRILRVAAQGPAASEALSNQYLSVRTGDDNVGVVIMAPAATERETFRIHDIGAGPHERRRIKFELPGLWFAPAARSRRIWSMPFDQLQHIFFVPEQGYRAFSLVTENNQWVRFSDDENFVFYLNDYYDERTIFSLALKVADDETQVGSLEPGELALYENPIYWGRVWVINSAYSDFAAVPSVLNSVSSVRLGPGTAATLYHTNSAAPSSTVRQDLVSHIHDMRLTQIGDNALTGIRPWRMVAAKDCGVSYTCTLSQDYVPGTAQQTVNDITVYRTVIEVPALVGKVRVWTTDTAVLMINGVSYNTDEDSAAEITPRAGRITVTMNATRLTAPGLKLQLDTMNSDERLVIFPDQAAHARLRTLEPATLANAKDSRGRDLIPEPADKRISKAAVAQVICNVVKAAFPPPPTATAPHMPGAAPAHTAATGAADQGNISTSATWKLSFAEGSAGTPSFRSLSEEEARTERDTLSALNLASVAYAPLNVGDFFGSLFGSVEDWIDITIEDIKRYVEQGVEFLVTQVGNGLQIIIKGFENEVLRPLKDFVISSAQAIAQFVESVIQKIGVVVEEFVRFIRSVFDWDKFRQSQTALKAMANHALTRLQQLVASAEQPVNVFFQRHQRAIEQEIDALIVQLGEKPAADPDARQVSPSFEMPDLNLLNWLLDKVYDLWDKIAPDALKPPPIDPDFQQLLDSINSSLRTVAASMLNVSNAVAALFFDPTTGKPIDPAQYFQKPQLLAARLLNVIKEIAKAGLTTAQALVINVIRAVNYMIRAFQKMLNETINIPFLSDLFRTVVGIDLSLMNLGTLMLAIPVTLVLGEPLSFDTPAAAPQPAALSAGSMSVQAAAGGAVNAASAGASIEKSKKAVNISVALIVSNIDMFLDMLGMPEGLETGSANAGWLARGSTSVLGETPGKALEIASWLLSILAWGADAPGDNWFVPDLAHIGVDDGTPEYWSNVVWFFEMAGLVLDGIALIPMQERARRAELIGVAAATVHTVALLGLVSKLAAVRPNEPAENAEKFMGLWPSLFCSLRIKEIVEATYGATPIIVGQLDRVAGFVTFGVGAAALSSM